MLDKIEQFTSNLVKRTEDPAIVVSKAPWTQEKAEKLGIKFQLLFMRANGKQLNEITKLIEARILKPVIEK